MCLCGCLKWTVLLIHQCDITLWQEAIYCVCCIVSCNSATEGHDPTFTIHKVQWQIGLWETYCDGWWCWWVGYRHVRGCMSPKLCRTILHSVGTAPEDEHWLLPEPVRMQQHSAEKLNNKTQQKAKKKKKHMYIFVTLTLIKGKAGPGAKGSFSCSIWYRRYSSTPCCSNTFCSRSVRNKTREETAMVTAFSGLGYRKNKKKDRLETGMIKRLVKQ